MSRPCMFQGLSNTHPEFSRLNHAHPAVPKKRTERLALDKFHNKIRNLTMGASRVDSHNARMVELCNRRNFKLQSGKIDNRDLYAYIAVQRSLLPAINNSHPPPLDFFNYLEIFPYDFACCEFMHQNPFFSS